MNANKTLGSIRTAMRQQTIADETLCVEKLVNFVALDDNARREISKAAVNLIHEVRNSDNINLMESFLAEYSLTSKEGIALMCLAEAMLRVPDEETIDDLIRDKITPHNWSAHLGNSGSSMVNASTWALMLTGRVLSDDSDNLIGTLKDMTRRLGEPVIRQAISVAMQELGDQFVHGQNIQEALERSHSMVDKGYTYSFDMLGEAARTEEDAARYYEAYADAINAIATVVDRPEIRDNPGISVKLSALHPRYEASQRDTVVPIIAERLLKLCLKASVAGVGLNIDAEEADRLDLSLDIIEAVLSEPHLSQWDGFGVVVQAYGKRAPVVIDWLYQLASGLNRQIMVRLVKGAYWDTEIKQAQVAGINDYPVFTRKAHTDISYLACAKKLLSMQDRIYAQFATHNAHTAAAILFMARDGSDHFEFQRLHGMGEELHDVLVEQLNQRCRIYAPVGPHRNLLAYLVRRLLENGANSSFVYQIVDAEISPKEIARDPIDAAKADEFTNNPQIPLPGEIFGNRVNAAGWNVADCADLKTLTDARSRFDVPHQWIVKPMTHAFGHGHKRMIKNPANADETVGEVLETDIDQCKEAISLALIALPAWSALPVQQRADRLRDIANFYEENTGEFLSLLCREAGKTLPDAVSEIREAVDFLRYYADHASDVENDSKPYGVVVCISPWNFPLAIFTGQIAAALVTGNVVLAKPAEQTPLIASKAISLMHQTGIPDDVLQLLPGDGPTIGEALVSDARIGGVCFTGSTDVAKHIDRTLAEAQPNAMLIAETGGLNAMIVDSTALMEQAVGDIVRAAFQSAGQRCSALRILYVQEDIEQECLDMLCGAMETLRVGNPWALSTDVGPVIEMEARDNIRSYINSKKAEGSIIKSINTAANTLFIGPTLIRVNGIEDMEKEIFGPILHVASFDGDHVHETLDAINAKGYGLTLGLHSRIDSRVQEVIDTARVGNIYVNRDQIGAVVGSQPFGGQGLSGTGPKAGGPLYLSRFRKKIEDIPQSSEAIDDLNTGFIEIESLVNEINTLDCSTWSLAADRINTLRSKLRGKYALALSASATIDQGPIDLPGPTGELNQYYLKPKGVVVCLGPDIDSLMNQTIQALAMGNAVIAISPKAAEVLEVFDQTDIPLANLNGNLQIDVLKKIQIDAVAYSGNAQGFKDIRNSLAARKGSILPLISDQNSPAAYCHEHSVCIDTTAAGGNASLLALAGE